MELSAKSHLSASGPLNFRIVVVGGSGVGKTAVLRRFLFDDFADSLPSKRVSLHKLFLVNGISLEVDFEERNTPRPRILDAHAILLLYSLTDPSSFAQLKDTLTYIQEVRSDVRSIPIVLAGNMADAPDRRLVSSQEVKGVLVGCGAEWNCAEMEVSAKTGFRVRDIFQTFLTLSRLLEVYHNSITRRSLKVRRGSWTSSSEQRKLGSQSVELPNTPSRPPSLMGRRSVNAKLLQYDKLSLDTKTNQFRNMSESIETPAEEQNSCYVQ